MSPRARPKVAVIGAGISGLACAYWLSRSYDVTVLESAERIGGHTATKAVSVDSGSYAVDTGFIVYNDRTYPNFIHLMRELGVEGQPTDMGFSVSCDQTGLEYAGTSIKGLFAQPSRLLSLQHWRMLKDILRFNRHCTRLYETDQIPTDITLDEFLRQHRYSRAFRDYYILPMVSAIWSSGTATAGQMPLQFFIKFFHNHGLLTITNQPQWYTVRGGSHSYLEPLTRPYADAIRTDVTVESVERTDGGALVRVDGETLRVEEVVFACHSDQALALLADPTERERAVLGAIEYQPNEVVLHTDASVLPRSRAAWASWNYRVAPGSERQTLLTYNMNILQRLEAPETFCVSVNPGNQGNQVNEADVLGRFEYHHPLFTPEAVAAQQRWGEVSGVEHTHFCGAYWRNGFHEDGVVSALNVARSLGAVP